MAAPMHPRYEVEVTVSSARNLKNVNWRNAPLRPYAVLWIDDGSKCSTKIASSDGGDSSATHVFDDKITVHFPSSNRRIEDSVLHVDIVHARSESDVDEVKTLVGSATIPLRDVVDEVGIGGGKLDRTLKLKRPSGRPQGKLEVRITVKEPLRYYDPYPQPARTAYPYGGGYVGQPAYGGPPTGLPLRDIPTVGPRHLPLLTVVGWRPPPPLTVVDT